MRSKDIIQDIIEQILSGELVRDARLPSEAKLAEQYDVNRHTIRKAVDALIERGYVRKQPSGHAYVNHDPSKYSLKLGSLFDLYAARDIRTEVLRFEQAPAGEAVANRLRIDETDPVWSIVRVRWAMGRPHHIEYTYMPVALFPNLTRKDCEASVMAYIEYTLEMEISHGIKTMRAAMLDDFEAQALQMNAGDLAIQIENVGYLSDGHVYEYSINRHRNDEGITYYAKR